MTEIPRNKIREFNLKNSIYSESKVIIVNYSVNSRHK